MLSLADIRAVPLFLTLSEEEQTRLTQTAADLHLAVGEFAVPEGGERALYAMLSGKCEVVKLFDGVERRLGFRGPGTIFGEVPLALGSPFPGGYRAVEPSRVMRVDAAHYYRLAASSPDFATRMGALARERLGGLQAVAAEPVKARLTLLGDRFDPECVALRRFLTRNQVSFEWLMPDQPGAADKWADALPARLPAVRLSDGAVLEKPQARSLAKLLGLQTAPLRGDYDTMIIGGGPAGLAAALYGASEGLRTIVVEREAPGGQAGTSSRIENYLGFPNGVSGDELASRALQQARRLGAEILVTRQVENIDPARTPGGIEVTLDGGETVRTLTLILATGVSWRRLAIDGAERLIGKGLTYGAARGEAGATHGLDVHLIGAGNSAGQAALNFASHARSVSLVVRKPSLERSMSPYLVEQLKRQSNIGLLFDAEVKAVHGEPTLNAIDIAQGGETRRVASGGLYVFIGADAETAWLPPAIARDWLGYVLTGDDVMRAGRWDQPRDPLLLETSVPGIFACGDVRLNSVKRVAAAVGEGSIAIAFVHQFLQQQATG